MKNCSLFLSWNHAPSKLLRDNIGALRGNIGALRGNIGALRDNIGGLRGNIGALSVTKVCLQNAEIYTEMETFDKFKPAFVQ